METFRKLNKGFILDKLYFKKILLTKKLTKIVKKKSSL